jgi:O-antigen/teichoic acid export membrane protein
VLEPPAAPARGGVASLGARFRALPKAGRRISVVVSGTALGQAVTVLASPVLTRLYGPSDLGALAVYAALVSACSVVICLRYELCINLCASEGEAANALALALLSMLGLSGLSVVGVLFTRHALALATGAPELAQALWLLPLSLAGMGTYTALSYWAIRRSDYGRLARTKVAQGLTLSAAQLGLGALGAVPAGLFVADALSRSSGVGTLARAMWRHDRGALREVSWRGMVEVARRYRRFPLLGSGSAVANTLSVEAPVFLLALHYSTRVTGDYALVHRLLALPLVLLGRAVGMYYVGEATCLLRSSKGEVRALFRRTVVRLALCGALPLALGGLLCPWLVPLVFGAAWHEAGRYALVVAVLSAAQFVAVPVSETLNFLERQDLQLAWDGGRLVLVLAVLGTAFALGASPMEAISAFAAVMALAYLALLLLCARALRAPGPARPA